MAVRKRGLIKKVRRNTKMSPLTKKGTKVKKAFVKTYGKKRGERVFYASESKGTIKGVAKKRK